MKGLGERWYVVQTQPHAEAKAVSHLLRQGFTTYFPRCLKQRRHARKIETVAAPFFPGYVFVAFDMAVQRWRSIQSTAGVTRLVCNGDDPALVPQRVLEEIRRKEDERGFIRIQRKMRFRPGDKIRVNDGPFQECHGLFEVLTDKDRVAILLDLLGRKVRVTLDAGLIAAM